jgi:hypothetical protein
LGASLIAENRGEYIPWFHPSFSYVRVQFTHILRRNFASQILCFRQKQLQRYMKSIHMVYSLFKIYCPLWFELILCDPGGFVTWLEGFMDKSNAGMKI